MDNRQDFNPFEQTNETTGQQPETSAAQQPKQQSGQIYGNGFVVNAEASTTPSEQTNDNTDFINQNQQPMADNYQSFSPNMCYDYNNKRQNTPKKPKKRFGGAALIACCLACAVISGTASAAVVSQLQTANGEQGASTSGTSDSKTINISSDEDTVSAVNAASAVAEKVIPSVVGIKTAATSGFGFGMTSESQGSGVIYSEDGYIITNYHVIQDAMNASGAQASTIYVYLSDDADTGISAKVIGYNSTADLAVLKIEKTGLTAIELANSDELKVGEMAIAIGNPGGLDYMSSVSSGIVSGLNRTSLSDSGIGYIQTDAAINPGNSGGALVDSEGKLIGINTAKISAEDYEGMGFAIPSNTVKEICDNIIANKDVKKAYIGVNLSNYYSSDILQSWGYPAGVVIESVVSGSPAEKAGLQPYDIITAIGDVDVTSANALTDQLQNYQPGETVSLTIYRYTTQQTTDVSVTLGESQS